MKSYRWLETGAEGLARMLALVREARQSVRLQFYIFDESTIATEMQDALCRAAQRGVRTRVLVDAFGSMSTTDSFWQKFHQSGVIFRRFNPDLSQRFRTRDHRKIFVIDEEYGIIGGFNIADEYNGDGVEHGWRDLGMELHGKVVTALAEVFDATFETAEEAQPRLPHLRRAQYRVIPVSETQSLLVTGPGRSCRQLRNCLRQDFDRARKIQILCAYFLPNRRVLGSLRRAARRGAKVELLLPGKSDVLMSRQAARSLYSRMLRSGIRIYEYQPQILHAKLFIVDDTVYVGSANLDTRSLQLNRELLLRINDPEMAEEARRIFERDREHSQSIQLSTWRDRGFWQRLHERFAYAMLAYVDPWLSGTNVTT